VWQEDEMSEENSAVEGGQEEQAAPEPVEADATPAESKADDNGVVAGDADEARTRNWVPYEERFKPVLQERNQFRDEVERIRGENQRLHDMMYSQQQQSRSQQDYGQQGEEEDWGDPDHMARKYAQLQERLSGFELKQEAERRVPTLTVRLATLGSLIRVGRRSRYYSRSLCLCSLLGARTSLTFTRSQGLFGNKRSSTRRK
jgi:hypothetical protein